ncbi:hypothetical protein SDC9_101002 [bioreactor metagenome]|uniref:Uncharacterized protein n=1 Tax=bioreactor metagenome TaxID=1076179 RepID=A0A645AN89_9ZZZZ
MGFADHDAGHAGKPFPRDADGGRFGPWIAGHSPDRVRRGGDGKTPKIRTVPYFHLTVLQKYPAGRGRSSRHHKGVEPGLPELRPKVPASAGG